MSGNGTKAGKPWTYRSLAEIIEQIRDPKVLAVSFDFFDTLVVRPLDRGDDLYDLLDVKFAELNDSRVSFGRLRREAEAVLRRKILSGEYPREDCTLEEIYGVLKSLFFVDPDQAEKMMNEEILAETALASPRRSGAKLLRAAVDAGKPVIVLSDMYLPETVLRKIASSCGLEGIGHFFVSSDTGKRKLTGSLYTFAAKAIGLPPGAILHIGDNELQDCGKAVEQGWRAAYLPGTMECFSKCGAARQPELMCRDLVDWEAAGSGTGLCSMRKMAANFYFDDPFRPFDPDSDYNRDPLFTGYAALGPEVLALVQWLADEVLRDGVKRLCFSARDGWLPMQVYEWYRAVRPELPPASYLRISRRSLLPVMLRTETDFFDLPADLRYQTPRKLLSLLSFAITAGRADFPEQGSGAASDAETAGPERTCSWTDRMDEPFTRASYDAFIRWFLRNLYDPEAHRMAKERCTAYLLNNPESPLTEGSGLFDLGLSGRTAAAAAEAAGIQLPVYYFQTDPCEHFRQERRSSIRIRSFLDFSPYMEPSAREYAYLEPAASCIGYDAELNPVCDAGPAPGYTETAKALQKGALSFVQDYLRFFAGYEKAMSVRGLEAAIPFEAFLRYCSAPDRTMFSTVLLDDELWGGRRNISLTGLMKARLSRLPEYAAGEGRQTWHEADRNSRNG